MSQPKTQDWDSCHSQKHRKLGQKHGKSPYVRQLETKEIGTVFAVKTLETDSWQLIKVINLQSL